MKAFKGKKTILLAVAIGTFMSALDSSVVNIVLPKISTYFNAPLSTIEWIVMSYLLVVSSLLLAYGRLGDMYGHKRIYIWGFIIFTAGSLLCGFSATVLILIIFRAIQAIGAGMLMAMGPAIVTDTVEPEARGKALSVIAVAVAGALTIGPVLGGALTVLLGWQSIFFVNIPIGVIGVWLAQKNIPDRGERTAQSFDFPGAALVFLALVSILLPLSLVEHYGWRNPVILSFIGVGLLLAAIFVVWEKRSANPMFDISLFENRLISMSNLSSLLNFMGQFTIILLMPYYLQQLRGLSPEKAGLIYLAMPLVTMLIAPISGTLSDRMDSRYISASGMGFMALGMTFLSNLQADSPYSYLIVSLAMVGLGIGLFQTPNNSAIMGAVPQNKRGIASGMQATMRNIGMVLGVAISGALFTSRRDALLKLGIVRGLQGIALKNSSFVGALHMTYIVAACFAAAGIITSLVKGSTRNNE